MTSFKCLSMWIEQFISHALIQKYVVLVICSNASCIDVCFNGSQRQLPKTESPVVSRRSDTWITNTTVSSTSETQQYMKNL